jgi:hypothetical protein
MADNTSATGGPLSPSDVTPPLYGDGLYDFFNSLVAGITGIDGDRNIIPAWQEEPPNLPAVGTNWVALAIGTYDGEPYASELHNPGDGSAAGFQGSDTVMRQEILSLQCSFYGPGAGAMMALFRDGMSVAQNREPLLAQNMGLLSFDRAETVPSLIKQKWLNRIVITARFRRAVVRTYPVLDLLSAGGTAKFDKFTDQDGVTDTFEASKPQT